METGKTGDYFFLYMYSYNPQTRDRGTTADEIYHAEWNFDILRTILHSWLHIISVRSTIL